MIRVERATAYVTTVREAFIMCDAPGIDYVVIEDAKERARLMHLGRAVETCKAKP